MKSYDLDRTVVLIFLISTSLYGKGTLIEGCSSSMSKESKGCELKSIFKEEKKDISTIEEKLVNTIKAVSHKEVFKIHEEEGSLKKSFQTNISRDLRTIKITHKNQKITIIRKVIDDTKSCPPYCIVPMNIDGVKTVGELETLDFIKNLNKNADSLLLDMRENKDYNKGTIPAALNLPSHMLKEDSAYFKEVLTVLGIKYIDGKWVCEDVHDLLLFDDGPTDNKAFEAIKSLLKLSYPSNKIFYYRGGFNSWKSLGLTVYEK